jgi:protease I
VFVKRVLFLVDKEYEDLELWYPRIRLEEEGYSCIVAAPESEKEYMGKSGYPCVSHMEFGEAEADDFDALVIPGGYAPDRMRRYHKVLEITRNFHRQGKCIAFICHAGWVPISAGILQGKRATSFEAIKDDMINAGAIWEDKEVVIDGNLVSSRTPYDLPYFCKAIIKVVSSQNGDAMPD